MTEVPAAGPAAELKPATGSSALSWVILALWAAWLAFMIVLSWPEIGRTRKTHEQSTDSSLRLSQP